MPRATKDTNNQINKEKKKKTVSANTKDALKKTKTASSKKDATTKAKVASTKKETTKKAKATSSKKETTKKAKATSGKKETVKKAKAKVKHSYSYVGNSNSGKFHRSTCTWAKRTASYNRVKLSSRSQAINWGYIPCKVCKP